MQNERKRPAFTKLTQSQFFKLCQYLKDNKARAEKHHWGATEAARFATSELKFQIGYQSVARADL